MAPQGPATWRIQNGQVVGTVQGDGGWLVSNRGYQDVGVQFAFRCAGECQSGVLLGMEKQGDSTKGLYISLAPGDLSAYEMTLNAQGQEVARTKPRKTREAGAKADAVDKNRAMLLGRSVTPWQCPSRIKHSPQRMERH